MLICGNGKAALRRPLSDQPFYDFFGDFFRVVFAIIFGELIYEIVPIIFQKVADIRGIAIFNFFDMTFSRRKKALRRGRTDNKGYFSI
ncbi:hypothetical protein C5946_01140 [Cronobacter sakazakii]|nr:hypothetical protein C3D64_04870 [Cronobacter sakazakii]PQY32915.1 hypothetical protein C5946_01140 [Cronobacter sakazakii]